MSKNASDREKHRQKKAAKHKVARVPRVAAFKAEQARLAAYRAKMQALRQQRADVLKSGTTVPLLSDEDYLFWLCHGANYLASNSETGEWSPIFEGIYSGETVDAEEVARKVMANYKEILQEEDSQFGGVPRAVLAWTVTEKHIVSVYKYEAVRRVLEKDPECDAELVARTPHNPVIWALMDKIKARSLAAGVQMDEEEAEADSNAEAPEAPAPDEAPATTESA